LRTNNAKTALEVDKYIFSTQYNIHIKAIKVTNILKIPQK